MRYKRILRTLNYTLVVQGTDDTPVTADVDSALFLETALRKYTIEEILKLTFENEFRGLHAQTNIPQVLFPRAIDFVPLDALERSITVGKVLLLTTQKENKPLILWQLKKSKQTQKWIDPLVVYFSSAKIPLPIKIRAVPISHDPRPNVRALKLAYLSYYKEKQWKKLSVAAEQPNVQKIYEGIIFPLLKSTEQGNIIPLYFSSIEVSNKADIQGTGETKELKHLGVLKFLRDAFFNVGDEYLRSLKVFKIETLKGKNDISPVIDPDSKLAIDLQNKTDTILNNVHVEAGFDTDLKKIIRKLRFTLNGKVWEADESKNKVDEKGVAQQWNFYEPQPFPPFSELLQDVKQGKNIAATLGTAKEVFSDKHQNWFIQDEAMELWKELRKQGDYVEQALQLIQENISSPSMRIKEGITHLLKYFFQHEKTKTIPLFAKLITNDMESKEPNIMERTIELCKILVKEDKKLDLVFKVAKQIFKNNFSLGSNFWKFLLKNNKKSFHEALKIATISITSDTFAQDMDLVNETLNYLKLLAFNYHTDDKKTKEIIKVAKLLLTKDECSTYIFQEMWGPLLRYLKDSPETSLGEITNIIKTNLNSANQKIREKTEKLRDLMLEHYKNNTKEIRQAAKDALTPKEISKKEAQDAVGKREEEAKRKRLKEKRRRELETAKRLEKERKQKRKKDAEAEKKQREETDKKRRENEAKEARQKKEAERLRKKREQKQRETAEANKKRREETENKLRKDEDAERKRQEEKKKREKEEKAGETEHKQEKAKPKTLLKKGAAKLKLWIKKQIKKFEEKTGITFKELPLIKRMKKLKEWYKSIKKEKPAEK